MDLEPLAGYLNCFRYGTPPHGGLGLGLTRLLMVMLGLPTIREATFLFRGPNRLEP
jgi:aspartyl/asparaginyl-tRNA synthetase